MAKKSQHNAKAAHEIKSCIVCDYARKEMGGKDTLVGVYGGILSVPDVPFTMPSLAIWIQIKPPRGGLYPITMEIVRPDGQVLVGIKGEIEFNNNDDYGGIPFQLPAITFPSDGIYKIRFGIGDELSDIGKFQIKKEVSTKRA